MVNLTHAHRELFSRREDERFETITDLHQRCQDLKARSVRLKAAGSEFRPTIDLGDVALRINGHEPYRLNDWSFSQLCGIAGVSKETLNRLRPETVAQVFSETLSQRTDEDTDLQALILDNRTVRAVNGERYKRLWNADVTAMLKEFAVDFTPPQKGFNGATGLYAGEQDMFCFLIDPAGWTEIHGEAFAPGFFVWNSEVGKRTVGVSTFWFQSVCANHIVWDATEVTEFTRKHMGKIRDSLAEIRSRIEALVVLRDKRKDGFAGVIAKAMETTYGHDGDEVQTLLAKAGFSQALAKKAIAQRKGRFTVWSVVEALTQIAREHEFAGNRSDADQKASALLALVA